MRASNLSLVIDLLGEIKAPCTIFWYAVRGMSPLLQETGGKLAMELLHGCDDPLATASSKRGGVAVCVGSRPTETRLANRLHMLYVSSCLEVMYLE